MSESEVVRAFSGRSSERPPSSIDVWAPVELALVGGPSLSEEARCARSARMHVSVHPQAEHSADRGSTSPGVGGRGAGGLEVARLRRPPGAAASADAGADADALAADAVGVSPPGVRRADQTIVGTA